MSRISPHSPLGGSPHVKVSLSEKNFKDFAVVADDLEQGPLLQPVTDDEAKPQPSQEARRVFLGIPVQVCVRFVNGVTS